MRVFRLVIIVMVLVVAFGTVGAQGEPLRIGGVLPGDIAWSPDGAGCLSCFRPDADAAHVR